MGLEWARGLWWTILIFVNMWIVAQAFSDFLGDIVLSNNAKGLYWIIVIAEFVALTFYVWM